MSPKGREYVSILLPKPHQLPDHCWLRAISKLEEQWGLNYLVLMEPEVEHKATDCCVLAVPDFITENGPPLLSVSDLS